MRFLGYLFLLVAIVALVLDVLFMINSGSGEFQLRALVDQLGDVQLAEAVAPYNEGLVAQALALPGALLLGGIGIAFLILGALLGGGD